MFLFQFVFIWIKTDNLSKMFHRVTRTSLCLEKVLYRSRLLYPSHRHEFHRVGPVDSGQKQLSSSRAVCQHCGVCPPALSFRTVNVLSSHRRFYSDFKDDDMVKSWIQEIKEDFDKKKSTRSEQYEEFKDIESESDATVEKMLLDESSNLSQDEQVSMQKLKEFANKFAGIELTEKDLSAREASTESTDQIGTGGPLEGFTKEEMIQMLKDKGVEITEAEAVSSDSDSSSDSGSDSDSDLLSSSSDSDSSDNENIGDKKAEEVSIKDKPAGSLEGFTKDGMIKLLNNTKIKGISGSDFDKKTNNLDIDENVSDESSSKSVADDSGIAASKIGKEGLKEDWAVVEIEDFVDIVPEPDVEAPWTPPISLERELSNVA